ncbi:DUF2334 domain-containing protein [Aurantiacibacter marinus]|uniref:NodB homology domain-containing protein n=1 Tax=Aurantiacibacter marinus TaxID=874156 RepID=A0A0H0XM95_9SPHN|nr:DUF2334 domain-containing protein [Aurantiacibacter marinus]KLI63077.1 hypothetical protein AAV99_10180 [Aurantiacibacter marinus]
MAGLAFLGLLAACTTHHQNVFRDTAQRPLVVLKLDDFRANTSTNPGWEQAFVFLNENDVTASIGVIGDGLEDPAPDAIAWLRGQQALGNELWNHGYCHCRSGTGEDEVREFRYSGFATQLDGLRRTQELAQQHFGAPFAAFGAPYNSTDEDTSRALDQTTGIAIWMFKDTDDERVPSALVQLRRIPGLGLEDPVHEPDFDSFLAGFEAASPADVLVLQGHPQSWVQDPLRFEEFQRIIRFLIAENARFLTPSEAAALPR